MEPTLTVSEDNTNPIGGATLYTLRVPLEWRMQQPSVEVAANRIAFFLLRELYTLRPDREPGL